MYLLDTNVVVALLKNTVAHLSDRFRFELGRGTAITLPIHVHYELEFGAAKSAHPERNRMRLVRFAAGLADMPPFDALDAAEAGAIRAALEARGTPIGPVDILIAAQARRRGAVLVTLNRREFDRVDGLFVTDWAGGG